MFDLESAIKSWLKSFSEYRSFDHGSVREMELHIRDHIDDLMAEGLVLNKDTYLIISIKNYTLI